MATVKVNELHLDDLPWIVEYDETKCIQCGKCERQCPQKLSIREDLKKVQTDLDKREMIL